MSRGSGIRILCSIKRPRSRAFSSRRRLISATDESRSGNSLSVLLKSKTCLRAPPLDSQMIAHRQLPLWAGFSRVEPTWDGVGWLLVVVTKGSSYSHVTKGNRCEEQLAEGVEPSRDLRLGNLTHNMPVRWSDH